MVFCGAHQHTISHICHSHPTTAIESHRNVYHSVTALMQGDKSATMTDTFWFSQHLPDLGFSVSVHCLTKQLKIRLLGCIQTLGLLRRRAEAVAVDVRQRCNFAMFEIMCKILSTARYTSSHLNNLELLRLNGEKWKSHGCWCWSCDAVKICKS